MEGKHSLCLSEIFIVTFFFFYFLGGILISKGSKTEAEINSIQISLTQVI